MERMMKVQEVILKAMAGSLKWWEAAEIIGVTDRTMRRWRQRYQEGGYDGLYDHRKRQPSPKRVPLQTAEKVLQLYREKYFDFKVRHFHEKLTEEHGVRISYTWVKMARQGAGLVNKQRRRGTHRRRPAAAAIAGDVTTHRRQQACLVWGWAVLRSDHSVGRCHQRDLLCATGGGGRNAHADASSARSDRTAGYILRLVQ